MAEIKRIYQSIIDGHLQNYGDKILLLAGPRQVGKTTLGHMCLRDGSYHKIYLNWDVRKDREKIKSGLQNIVENLTGKELSRHDETNVL